MDLCCLCSRLSSLTSTWLGHMKDWPSWFTLSQTGRKYVAHVSKNPHIVALYYQLLLSHQGNIIDVISWKQENSKMKSLCNFPPVNLHLHSQPATHQLAPDTTTTTASSWVWSFSLSLPLSFPLCLFIHLFALVRYILTLYLECSDRPVHPCCTRCS